MILKRHFMSMIFKRLQLFVFFLISIPVFGDKFINQEWANFGSSYYFYLVDDNQLFIKVSGNLLHKNTIIRKRIIDKYDFTDIKERKDGYLEIGIFGGKQIILYGGNRISFSTIDYPMLISHYFPNANRMNKKWIVFAKTNIDKVKASSVLKDESERSQIDYSTKDLLKTFTVDSQFEIIDQWNHELIPWAEGEEGPGIGVTLDITFKEPSNHLLIINGYVDFGKTYLYKANNRIKTALFRSLDPENPFEMEYEFEDVVKFHEIEFPSSTEKVQLEIVSVYPGEKWDDTVITGMMTRIPESENMYDKWKDTFWNDAIPYHDDLNIEWDP